MPRLISLCAIVRIAPRVLLLLGLTACGGAQVLPPEAEDARIARLDASDANNELPKQLTLEAALADIRGFAQGQGIGPEGSEQLRLELARALEQRGVSTLVAGPPLGPHNQVVDLRVELDAQDDYCLRWSYLNAGDYDQNGEVNRDDLIPLGQHLGVGGPFLFESELSVLDGDRNGVIGLADVTVIGRNYLAYCASYNIYGATDAEGPWELLSSAGAVAGPVDGRRTFSFAIEQHAYALYQVRPVDATGAEGVASAASVEQIRPAIVSVAPHSGVESKRVAFTVNTTMSTPETWLWDFGGGAAPNISTDELPRVILGRAGEYSCEVRVGNQYGEASAEFSLTVLPPGEKPHVTQVTPAQGIVGEEVAISAVKSGTPPFDHLWWFGSAAEPSMSSEAAPRVVLNEPGQYQCTVTVVNAYGVDTYAFELTVLQPGESARVLSVTPLSGIEGKVVTFEAEVTGSLPIGFLWYFQGGALPNSSTEASPVVQFGEPGTYGAWLSVQNAYGPAHKYSFTLEVFANSLPQVVLIADPTSGPAPLGVEFDASGSIDLDGTIVQFDWDWDGDGVYDIVNGTAEALHTYPTAGTLHPTVRVWDDCWASASATVEITVL